MKPITEYSFRDIVGHFVKFRFPEGRNYIDPECEDFIAYVYIDIEAGMTLEIIGAYKNGNVVKDPESSNKLRYSDDIMLEPYDDPDDEMLETAAFIEENYTPDWIGPVRENPMYDPYRDKVYPDDLLIPIHSLIEENGKLVNIAELLWVHPVLLKDENLFGITIEPGKYFEQGTQVMIVRITSGDYKISAMTLDMVKKIATSDDPASFFREL